MSDAHPKTLVFCTAFTWPNSQSWHSWEGRYRVWLDAMIGSDVARDQILIVDDGSDTLPGWTDVTVLTDADPLVCTAPVVLYHFTEHLGRRSVSDFPGWVRSFFFVAKYAAANGFEKLVHVESDAFLISRRCRRYVDMVDDGWIAFWCPRWTRPESGIQVIAGRSMQQFSRLAERHYEDYAGVVIEDDLPFTHVEKALRGDRHGEFLDHVPFDADFTMQACNVSGGPRADYFWWLPESLAAYRAERPDELGFHMPRHVAAGRHDGLDFPAFLTTLDAVLHPASYFEIGSSGTGSLRCFTCDSLYVDPDLTVTAESVGGKRRCLLHRCASSAFFAEDSLLAAFPRGVDIAFLDGLHLFEALLDDFVQTERACHGRSLLLLHDCLPLNARMAERSHRRVEDEDPATRDFWTGDVWKIVPTLRKYRPDLEVLLLDCPPTGLVLCRGLDPASTVLADRRADILAEFGPLVASDEALRLLWQLFPVAESARLAANPAGMRGLFDLRR